MKEFMKEFIKEFIAVNKEDFTKESVSVLTKLLSKFGLRFIYKEGDSSSSNPIDRWDSIGVIDGAD